MRPQRFPVQVMKEPGKINNDSGWCQDEPANHVRGGGGGGGGYKVTVIYQVNNYQLLFFR